MKNVFSDLSLGKKVIAGFIAIGLLSVLIGVNGLFAMNQMHQLSQTINQEAASMGVLSEMSTLKRNYGITMGILCGFTILMAIILGGLVGAGFTKRIKNLTTVVDKMSKGNISIVVEKNRNDELGVLSQKMDQLATFNKKQNEAIQRIANGEIDIDLETQSDNDLVGKSLQKIVNNNEKILAGIEKVSSAVEKDGKIGVKIDENTLDGVWKQIAIDINGMMSAIEEPMMYAADWVDQLARGEMVEEVEYEHKKGDVRTLLKSLNDLRETVNYLYFEVVKLNEEQKKGSLNHRIDITGINGGFQHILVMINEGVDAIIDPVVDASNVLNKLSNGDLNARVSGEYVGDYAQMKDALNKMGETIQSYIGETGEVLGKLSEKNFNTGIDREYVGDFKELKDALNNIVKQFNLMLEEIYTSADQVETATVQVSQSSQELSQGSVDQSSAVQQISASITQVAEQITTNASHSREANDISNRAKADAENGNDQMHQLLDAMESIKDSSKSISSIIKVIDDIAFQTNILALNAAVEAARAGEHGKGFAVVAEEVRNLAARSASAAKETTDLINNSNSKVDDGNSIAKNTAEALEKIVVGITEAGRLVESIADASNEQASAIAHINEGIDQVSQVTQTNSSTSEESAAASEEMAAQALALKNMIDEFELKNKRRKNKVVEKVAPRQRPSQRTVKRETVTQNKAPNRVPISNKQPVTNNEQKEVADDIVIDLPKYETYKEPLTINLDDLDNGDFGKF